ncbi:MAG: methylenetetrahydrofolate reductase [NAD(P)H] [Gammaproteobacteria bacterium]|nr:methylenetetrahydrofolate reductase [NAD(P)H] [Gammaproteobacteria bacterium]
MGTDAGAVPAGQRSAGPQPCCSVEFFPPRDAKQRQVLHEAARELAALAPDFFSVTFGAGGSTREYTLETVVELQRRTGMTGVPHISCAGSSLEQLRAVLSAYRAAGVCHLVALRGDVPSGLAGSGELHYASELVAWIRKETGSHFHIEVAAHPEFHPQAESAAADLEHFRRKVEAGANSAITQYFYNPDAYFRFLEGCDRLGIDIPIFPGVMPISSYSRLLRFSRICCAEVPRWLLYRLRDLEGDREGICAFGQEVVASLCERLLQGGAPGLHFYTLNRAAATVALWRQLGLPGAAPGQEAPAETGQAGRDSASCG